MSDKIINDVLYDFGDIEIKVGAKVYSGIKEISYKAKRDRGKFRGNSPYVRGMTRGTYDADGSITWTREGLDQFIDDQGDGWMEVEFDVVVTYGNNGQPVRTDTLVRCSLGGDDTSAKEGPDIIECKTDLTIHRILKNGKQPLRESTT